MKKQKTQVFTKKEEEMVSLLVSTGTKRIIATVLVYIANVPGATSRDIERGTDLRQPEVSLAITSLAEKSWIDSQENPSSGKGRPVKRYTLALPFGEILELIAQEKKKEVTDQLGTIKKIRKTLAEISE